MAFGTTALEGPFDADLATGIEELFKLAAGVLACGLDDAALRAAARRRTQKLWRGIFFATILAAGAGSSGELLCGKIALELAVLAGAAVAGILVREIR